MNSTQVMTQPFTAKLSTQTIDALSSIATPQEIDTLEAVIDLISRGRGKPWQAEYIVEIITRLAERENQHESSQIT